MLRLIPDQVSSERLPQHAKASAQKTASSGQAAVLNAFPNALRKSLSRCLIPSPDMTQGPGCAPS